MDDEEQARAEKSLRQAFWSWFGQSLWRTAQDHPRARIGPLLAHLAQLFKDFIGFDAAAANDKENEK